jgi:hypothetical protein
MGSFRLRFSQVVHPQFPTYQIAGSSAAAVLSRLEGPGEGPSAPPNFDIPLPRILDCATNILVQRSIPGLGQTKVFRNFSDLHINGHPQLFEIRNVGSSRIDKHPHPHQADLWTFEEWKERPSVFLRCKRAEKCSGVAFSFVDCAVNVWRARLMFQRLPNPQPCQRVGTMPLAHSCRSKCFPKSVIASATYLCGLEDPAFP